MVDIVDRLRNATPYGLNDHTLLVDAAAKIAELRSRLGRWIIAAEAYERGDITAGDRWIDEARTFEPRPGPANIPETDRHA